MNRHHRKQHECEMQTLNDDHLLMECDGVAVLEDGTRLPYELPVTVGMVRKYMADPHPCQCENCLRVLIPAVRLLGLQEDYLADRITEKQFKRGLKKLGYVRKGKIQY